MLLNFRTSIGKIKEGRSICDPTVETKSIWNKCRTGRHNLRYFNSIVNNDWTLCCQWIHIDGHMAIQKEEVFSIIPNFSWPFYQTLKKKKIKSLFFFICRKNQQDEEGLAQL